LLKFVDKLLATLDAYYSDKDQKRKQAYLAYYIVRGFATDYPTGCQRIVFVDSIRDVPIGGHCNVPCDILIAYRDYWFNRIKFSCDEHNADHRQQNEGLLGLKPEAERRRRPSQDSASSSNSDGVVVVVDDDCFFSFGFRYKNLVPL
jgi:hypothetical protein